MMMTDRTLEAEQSQAKLVTHANEKAPKIIYLQRAYDDLDDPRYNWPEETTWCVDQINSSDIEYIRADLIGITKDRAPMTEEQKLAYVNFYGELESELARVRAERDALREVAETAENFRKLIDSPDDIPVKPLRAFVLLQDALLTAKENYLIPASQPEEAESA